MFVLEDYFYDIFDRLFMFTRRHDGEASFMKIFLLSPVILLVLLMMVVLNLFELFFIASHVMYSCVSSNILSIRCFFSGHDVRENYWYFHYERYCAHCDKTLHVIEGEQAVNLWDGNCPAHPIMDRNF